MDESRRAEIDVRAQKLWEEAGRPEGRQEAYRAQAEAELQASVDAAVPAGERLPAGAEENPLSEHVESIAEGAKSGPGRSSFAGGDKVA
ncbi:MAG: DUF2934 domain-containing protein [Geminicoccaceae bacterium]